MSGLIRRTSLRHFLHHPVQTSLAVLGIALGVAVVVAIDLSTGSAHRAFEWSTEAAFGRATHQIVAGPGGVPDTAYARVRLMLGRRAAPVSEITVRAAHTDGSSRTLTLLGIDPFAEAAFRPWADVRATVGIGPLLVRPGALLLPAGAAQDLGVNPGDSLRITVSGFQQTATVLDTLPRSFARRGIANLAIADIATVQELAGRHGTIDRIDVILEDAAAVETLRSRLPSGSTLVETGARSAAAGDMTRAFTLNLMAFSLIALVFGGLLIYETMTFSIVQRRTLIGMLRVIGVTRREITTMVLLEALVIGLLATILGILLGVLLGSGMVRLVAQTINDLYFRVLVTGVSLDARTLVRATTLGIGATLAAALAPLREATRTQPRVTLTRSSLEASAGRRSMQAALAGVGAVLVAVLLLSLPGRTLSTGFAALFAIVVAGALLAPAGTVLLMRMVRPAATRAFGIAGSLASRGVTAALSRTAPAVASLMVAVSVGAAVGIMVGSFRHSVERWLDTSLQADLYVASASAGSRGEGTLEPSVVEAVSSMRGVDGVSTLRQTTIPFRAGDLTLVAADFDPRHRRFFTLLEDAGDAWSDFDHGAVLVSESFAWRNQLHAGSSIPLLTAEGMHVFSIAGIFRDYASEFGVVFISRSAYDVWWNDPGVSSLAVFLRPDASPQELEQASTAILGYGPGLSVRSNRALRASTLEVFDRTFVITGVLRSLALVVAFTGVLSALMALQLERGRELGVLRATGVTPRQLLSIICAQTGLLGLAAGVLAIPLSLALAWLLIRVINRRSFGWTLDMHIEPPALLTAIGLAVVAALLAGLWPARRMANTPPAIALREE